MTIPQVDLKSGYLAQKEEIDAAIARVLDSGWYILGREVTAFEQEFAQFVGAREAIGVANGTDALVLALRACEVGPGDAVITVSHTAVATVAAIELTGATPVLVDIDPVTYTIDPALLAAELARRAQAGQPVKAIIPVHLYGHPAALPAIKELAERHGARLIEDCAQAHAATVAGRQVGAWGDIAAFSFYPTKNLGAIGDGGMVVTSDPVLAERTRVLRQYGWRTRYVSDIPGLNSRLDELQAAILRVKLRSLAADTARRRELASLYTRLLAGTSLILPTSQPGMEHVYHLYVVRTPQRDALQAHLREQEIGTLVHYPVPVHLQPAYLDRLGHPGSLPETERAAREVLSLPLFPTLTPEQVAIVADTIVRWDRDAQQARGLRQSA